MTASGQTRRRLDVVRNRHVRRGGPVYREGVPGWPQPALPAQWTGTANLPPFVGRRREFETLEAIWPAAEAGARQVVFVGGEPGAGKSRLAAEAAAALHRNGVSVLVGSCRADLGLPFDPFVQPVRALLPAVDSGQIVLDGDAVIDAEQTRDMLRLLTEGTTRGSGAIAGARAAVVFEAVVAILRGACAAGSMLLVLEDLHWAGESALRALRFVVERTAALPMLVMGTHRSTRPDRSDRLSVVMADLMRLEGAHRLDLTGLDTDEVADFLTATGAGAGAQVRQGAALLRDSTGGNPFVLREVWRDLDRHGGLASLAAGQITPPDSLRALIAARLSALPDPQRRVVSLGAVIGEEFGIDLLRAADGGAEASSATTFAAMAGASAAGLVEPVPGRAGAMRFPHALARQAVIETMDAFELAAAHGQVGFALEEGFAGEGGRVQRLAHHFASAVGLGLDDRAVRYLEQAATTAMTRLANSDAAELFERAAGFASDASERDRLLLRAARCHHVAGRMVRAGALDERIATTGHPTHRLAAAVGYEATVWRGGVGAERAIDLLRDALARAPVDESDPSRIRALVALGRVLAQSGRLAEGRLHITRALAAVRNHDDQELVVAVLERAITLLTQVTPDGGLEWLRDQIAIADEITERVKRGGSLRPLATASTMRLFGAYVLGDPAAMEAAISDFGLVVRVTRQPFHRWTVFLIEGSRSIMRCEFSEASRLLAEGRALESSLDAGYGRTDGPWTLQSFMLRRETGGLEFARVFLEGADAPVNPWRPGLVALYTELGMADRARLTLQQAVANDLGRLRSSATWPAALSFLGEAAAWLGERECAAILLNEAECFAGLNLMGAEFLATLGSADRLLAVLKSVLRLPGVEQHFTTALEIDRRMRSILHVATTQAEWAAHLRRVQAPSARIEEHAVAARELADRYDLIRVRRILGPDATAAKPVLPDGLTAREVEVLRLIGEGRSNRDISRELYISENTAANHVRSILMKTQCPNRTAAAHYAVQHGLMSAGSGPSSEDRRQ